MATITADYSTGFHTAWERALCRALCDARALEIEVDYERRKIIVDTFVRTNPQHANDIVCCEFCQELIAVSTMENKKIWDVPPGVREKLEAYGILYSKKTDRSAHSNHKNK